MTLHRRDPTDPVVERTCRRDPALQAFALGDLDPVFRPWSTWYGWGPLDAPEARGQADRAYQEHDLRLRPPPDRATVRRPDPPVNAGEPESPFQGRKATHAGKPPQ